MQLVNVRTESKVRDVDGSIATEHSHAHEGTSGFWGKHLVAFMYLWLGKCYLQHEAILITSSLPFT